MNKKTFLSIVTLLACAACDSVAVSDDAQPLAKADGVITVNPDKPGVKVSPTLYGIFFEEINRAGEGGIYAEMIQNRSFEDNRNNPVAWGKFNADISLDRENPLNANNKTSLKIKANQGGGIMNGGFVRDFNENKMGSIAVKKGDKYDLSFFAKVPSNLTLTATIEQGGKEIAKAAAKVSGNTWKKYTITLTANDTVSDATLKLTSNKEATFNLDMVSLFPQKTWKKRKNGLRPDLMERLAAMKPAFVRFPGGCFVEGRGLENRAIWKNSIGPVEQRIDQNNIQWGYNCSNGLGFHEYLQMCEDLKAEPLFVINCGMAHNPRGGMQVVPMNEMQPFVQDALDAIEYANGDASTKWGKMRIQNGHEKPFNLKYMEIGNENGGRDYVERYKLIQDAILAKYPNMHLIANESTPGVKNEIIDPHMYSTPAAFFRDYTRFDNYDRKASKVYFGEYAVTNGSGEGNLIAAVGEAAFMCGLERNSDIVIMSSYAPLFVRTGWRAWNPNAIVFDQCRSYGTPSYWVQAMFGNNLPDNLLPVDMTSAPAKVKNIRGKIGVGTYQTQAEFKDIKVVKNGQTLFASDFQNKGMDGWTRIAGNWSVDGDILKQTSNDNNTFILAGDPNWENYSLSLKARKTGGAEGFLVSFGVQNREMRRWNIGGWGNASHALEADDFRANHVNGKIETGRWYDIRIDVMGDKVSLYLDGKKLDEQNRLADRSLAITAGVDNKKGENILKFVNGNDSPITYTVKTGKKSKVGKVTTITLTGKNTTDENSYSNPELIVPVKKSINVSGSDFNYTFPAYSVTFLRWKK